MISAECKLFGRKVLDSMKDTTLADKASLGLLVHCVLLTRKPRFSLKVEHSQHGRFKGQTASPNLFVYFLFFELRRMIVDLCLLHAHIRVSVLCPVVYRSQTVWVSSLLNVSACRHQQTRRFRLRR